MTTPVESRRARLTKAAASAAIIAAGLGGSGWMMGSHTISAPAVADATSDALTVSPLGSASCGFVNTWLAPRPGGRKHLGVDIMAKAGTPLLAVVDGTISRLNPDYPGSSAGNHINVRVAGGTTYYVYLHLQSFAPGMAVGTQVKAGDVIGYVGTTGSSSAPHLHFEVHPAGGSAVDPTGYVAAVGTCGKSGINNPTPTVPGTPSTTIPSAPSTTIAKPSTTVASPPSTVAPATTSPGANATSGATRIRPTTPSTVAPIAPATTVAAAAGGPVTTATPAPVTTNAIPQTTAAPVVTAPPALPPSLGVDVMLSGVVPANQTVSAKVVGGYGLRDSANSVEVTISTNGAWGGNGLVGPCGTDWLVSYGTPFTVPAGESQARVNVSPGHDGQICITTSVDTSFRVTIDAYR